MLNNVTYFECRTAAERRHQSIFLCFQNISTWGDVESLVVITEEDNVTSTTSV